MAEKKRKSNLWKLTPYFFKYKGRIGLAFVMLIGSKLLSVADPYVMKELIDTLVEGVPQGSNILIGLFVLFFVLRWGGNILDGVKDYVFARVQSNIKRFISLDVFKHLLDLPLSFHVSRSTGGLSRKITRGTSALEDIFFFLTFNIIPTIIEIIFILVIFSQLFPLSFTVVFIGFIVVYVTYSIIYTEYRQAMLIETNKRDDKAASVSIDAVMNYETVKYFSNEKYEYERLDNSLKKWVELSIKSTKRGANLNMGQGLIITAGLTAILGLAVRGYFQGNSTIGDFILVTTYLTRLASPLGFLGFMYSRVKEGFANIDEMFKLLKEKNTVLDKPDAKITTTSKGHIVFDNVTFGYSKERKALSEVSMEIPAKTRAALVGYSGSGKSTVSKLLLRMYDVDSGAIYLDGVDIRDLKQGSLRNQVGIVAQDNILFNDTIFYNITYGKTNATQEEVEQAAKVADIHDFIMSLPKRYDTVVGERGVKLSGGEKQRVAIARMLIKNPCLYVFDEATASLDTKSEKIIQKAISKLSLGGRTTLVIAHRLSTIVDFDKIFVFKEGKIAEVGNHKELLAKKGIYAALWGVQSREKEEI